MNKVVVEQIHVNIIVIVKKKYYSWIWSMGSPYEKSIELTIDEARAKVTEVS